MKCSCSVISIFVALVATKTRGTFVAASTGRMVLESGQCESGSEEIQLRVPKPSKGTVRGKENAGEAARRVFYLLDEEFCLDIFDTSDPMSTTSASAAYECSLETFEDVLLESVREMAIDLRYVQFDNAQQVEKLGDLSKRVLKNEFFASKLIIGHQGFVTDIKLALGLVEGTGPANIDEGEDENAESDGLNLLRRSELGHVQEIFLKMARDQPDFVKHTIPLIMEWYSQRKEAAAIDRGRSSHGDRRLNEGSSWVPIAEYEWKGYIDGTYRGTKEEDASAYTFRYTVFKIEQSILGKDFYRVDMYTQNGIQKYVYDGYWFGDTSGNCGWHHDFFETSIKVRSGNIREYMPKTSVGTTTTGFTIGGSIGANSGGPIGNINAGYSQSYSKPGVSTATSYNSVENMLSVRTNFEEGCRNYEWYPAYSGAENSARTSYDATPSVIIEIPEGETIHFSAGDNNSWRVQIVKTRLQCGFACFSLNVDPHRWYVNVSAELMCNKNGCYRPGENPPTPPPGVDLGDLSPQVLDGGYRREPVENGFHEVTVEVEGNNIIWKNEDGVSWSIQLNDGKLKTDPGSSYGEQEVLIELNDNGVVVALWFLDERYRLVERKNYIEIISDACETLGYETITNDDVCIDAATSLGRTIEWGPHGGYSDVVDGCSARFGSDAHLFLNQLGICDPAVSSGFFTECKCTESQPCFCSKSSVSPTTIPTFPPTTIPTFPPTTIPTLSPATSPTLSPATRPTLSPATIPTIDPTTSPSATGLAENCRCMNFLQNFRLLSKACLIFFTCW